MLPGGLADNYNLCYDYLRGYFPESTRTRHEMDNSEYNYLPTFWCGIFKHLEIALFKIYHMV